MLRYLRLLGIALRTSLLLGMQYRWDFLMQGGMQLMWMVLNALPLWVAFHARAGALGTAIGGADIGGWDVWGAVVVYGVFSLMRAVMDGAIQPSLNAVVEHIRQGTLDFVLLKPADAQFLVSTAKFEPWHVIDSLGALALVGIGVVGHSRQAGVPLPSLLMVLAAVVLFLCGVALLYSVLMLVICAAFYVVKIDNLSYLFTSIFDFARWPRSVFQGALLVLFTYVFPLVVMTSYPAEALRGQLGPGQAVWGLGAAVGMLVLSRLVWRGAIARYTSASS